METSVLNTVVMGRQPSSLFQHQFGGKLSSLKGFMAVVAMTVLRNILGSSRTWSCCYNSNIKNVKSAMKLCNKNSRETSATFTLESVQIIGYIYLGLDFENLTTTLQCLPKIHFITIVNLQHCMLLFLTLQLYKVMYDVVDLLLYLVQAIAISTKDMMVYMRQVSLAIKFVDLVPIYIKGFSALLPSGFQSCCLRNNALLPLGKNALLPFGEACHATTRDNALLPSQLGSQHYVVWLLRGFSAWLLKGPISLAPYSQDYSA